MYFGSFRKAFYHNLNHYYKISSSKQGGMNYAQSVPTQLQKYQMIVHIHDQKWVLFEYGGVGRVGSGVL